MEGRETPERNKRPLIVFLLLLLFGGLLSFGLFRYRLLGEVTIDDLVEPRSRLLAYHRLWRETKFANQNDYNEPLLRFGNFRKIHTEARLVKVPMPQPHPPKYILLRERSFLFFALTPPAEPWTSWGSVVKVDSWEAWWSSRRGPKIVTPPMELPSEVPVPERMIISLLDHEGKLLDETSPRPFRGNNMTAEADIFYDINGDGWVERVTAQNYGSASEEHKNTTIRSVSVTKIGDIETERIFLLAYQFNPYSSTAVPPKWDYECADHDGDGLLEIRIGPRSGTTLTPEVIFLWDKDTQTFQSPSGDHGPHHHVIRKNEELDLLFDLMEFPGEPFDR